jgi:hypothetical protein
VCPLVPTGDTFERKIMEKENSAGRVIKFRAWDGSKMVDSVIVFNGGASLDWRDFENGIFLKYPPMQFTGLHDKNGKGIYSGDILKNHIGLVYAIGDWVEDSDALKAIQDGIMIVGIIGNIYENPELLK